MTENPEQTPDDPTSASPPAESARAEAADKPAATPEDRIATLEAEKAEVRDRMLRIAAEFENWKKRARREQQEAETKGREAVLRDMLEVIDNLERATAAWSGTPDPQGVQQGVMLVLRMFQAKLERHDVKAIESKGQPFDPRLHDAVSQVPTAEVPPGTVLSDLQKGYKIGDRLLRPATVVVAVAPPAAPAGGGGGDGVGASNGSGAKGGSESSTAAGSDKED